MIVIVKDAENKPEDLHGGSVTMASKSSPHRHGLWVTSNVQRSTILDATPY